MGKRYDDPAFLIGPPRPKQPRVSRAKPRRPLKKMRATPRRKAAIVCRPHIDWVLASYKCLLIGKVNAETGKPHECQGPLDPHHEPPVSRGGGDNQVNPLCRLAHDLRHSMGRRNFQSVFGVDLDATGPELWSRSPHRLKHEGKQS